MTKTINTPIIGILGAGQLGRMLALAGYPLGLNFRFFDPDPQAPANHLAKGVTADYADISTLEDFASGVDVLTYEFENVPVHAAQLLNARLPVYPPPFALETSQDRLVEKTFLSRCGIPTPRFAPVGAANSETTLAAAETTGLPAVLKTRRMGYDGKGQRVVLTLEELNQAAQALGGDNLILEQFVPFSAEYSLLSVRSVSGEIAFYPLVRNVHRDGILRRSTVPEATTELQLQAESHAKRLLEELSYVGTLAIEFFLVNGALVANEIAPRVHNSGHWTIEGAVCSQFENHLRAMVGYPLGSTALTNGAVGMLNIIGSAPDVPGILAVKGAHLHLYGKSPRPGRKIGHITLTASSFDLLTERLEELNGLLG